MRILHLSSEKSWRGGEQQIAYLIGESKKFSIKVEVLARTDSAFEAWCIAHEVTVHSCGFRPLDSKVLKERIEEFAPDLIHAHSSKGHSLIAVAVARYGLKTPVIISRRVDFPLKNNPISRAKYNLNVIAKYICVSKAIEKMVRNGVKDVSKVTTIRSGIDLKKFDCSFDRLELHRRFGLNEKKQIVANVSALADHKDYFTFLDTCAELKKRGRDIAFFIIGDGPENESIRQYRDELGLKEDVHMTGFIEDIPTILSSISVFLITSKTEGLGTTILDAFACEVPVVATSAGGIPESVKDGVTGVLCPIKDPHALANGVEKVLDDYKFRAKLITGAKSHLLDCTKEKTAQKTFEVYREVLAERMNRPAK